MSGLTFLAFKKCLRQAACLFIAVVVLILNGSSIVQAQTAPLTRDQSALFPFLGSAGCSQGAAGASSPAPSAAGNKIYILGDSITARAAAGEKYQKAFPGKELTISARVGRSWKSDGQADNYNTGTQGTGASAVAEDASKIEEATGGIIIALGTNNYAADNPVDTILEEISKHNKSNAPIWWVNVANGPPGNADAPAFNELLKAKQEAGEITVIDWAKIVDPGGDGTNNPAGVLDDRTHPSIPDGVDKLVALVSSVVLAGASANPTQAAGTCVCGATAAPGSTGNRPAALKGEQPREQVFNFFNEMYPGQPWIAAGFIGNMTHESGLNPRALEPGTTGDAPIRGKGYGLVQWTFEERQVPLEKMAVDMNLPVYDMFLQLNYVVWELENKFQKTLERLLQLPTEVDPKDGTKISDKATEIIEIYYETHGGISPQGVRDGVETSPPHRFQQDRKNTATEVMTEFGSYSSGGGSGSTSCSTNSNGLANGEYAFPTDKSIYETNASLFTGPHHDYPAVDVGIPTGTNIYSMTAGTIISAPTGGDCGVGVEIDAGDGARFIYCHGSDGGAIPGAMMGDEVKPGDLIMHSASTGRSTGPHLHLGIRINGTAHCPQSLLVGIIENNVPELKSLPTGGCTY